MIDNVSDRVDVHVQVHSAYVIREDEVSNASRKIGIEE